MNLWLLLCCRYETSEAPLDRRSDEICWFDVVDWSIDIEESLDFSICGLV